MSKQRKFALFLVVLLVVVSLTSFYRLPQVKAALIEETRTFTSESYDGYLERIHGSYETAWNDASGTVFSSTWVQVGQYFYMTYTIDRAFLFFDTTLLPIDASITEVTLSLRLAYDYSTTDFNITLQNGQPTYPHQPLASGDYYQNYYLGDGGSLNTSELTGGYNNITFNEQALNWIQKTGVTKLCLRSSLEVNALEPTGGEYVRFYSSENGQSYAPKLYVTYEVEGCKYYFYGAFDEDTGLRNGNITVWVYPASATPYSFVLDGEYNITEEQIPLSFRFMLAEYNYSRYYVPRLEYEEIYVFKPNDPYYYYSLDIIDMVGVSNAYLESYVAVNGSRFTVERHKFIAGNLIPFVLNWGKGGYGFQIICTQGTYDFGAIPPPTTQETIMFVLTNLNFPPEYEVYENITLSATRTSTTTITVLYEDGQERTNTINVTVYRLGFRNAWTKEYTTQQSVNTLDLTWSNAEVAQNYVVKVTVNHADYGELTWDFPCLTLAGGTGSNPFDFGFLGEWPIDSTQIISIVIILIIFGLGSAQDNHILLLVGIVVGMIFIWIEWCAMTWAFAILMLCLAVLYAMSKRRQTQI